ncbi:MAG TPA: Rho termination factor N-terminal domain-containing protein, partial [Sedimentibacter sp.]|nr:Rho termination factor N-terminal domain-containing protein [Sedimentibacter sp.]
MDLKSLKLFELKALAKSKGIRDAYKYKKDELILKLNELETKAENKEDSEKINNLQSFEEAVETEQTTELPDKIVEEIESSGTEALKVTGILETHVDGYGFLRIHNYLTSDDDVYISPSQIRRFHMQTGDKITGITRPPKQGEKFKALLYVKEINDEDP